MKHVFPVLLTASGCILSLFNKHLLLLSIEDSFHFNLITVNALFGGFLYTNYSLLLGLMDNTIIEKIKNTSIIEKRNRHISSGIIYATVSVLAGLYVVLFSTGETLFSKALFLFALNAELVFMTFVIGLFVLSLHEMNLLVMATNKSNNKKSKEEIVALKNQIKFSAKSQRNE